MEKIEKQPVLSFVIPCYNVENYIYECLDSLYNQDIVETDFEVICINDCSTDSTLEKLKKYQQGKTNMFIHTNEKNLRQGESRSVGIDLATGKYIWFVDQDDFIEENVVSALIKELKINNLDILSFNYYNYYNDGKTTPVLPLLAETEVITGKQYVEKLAGINYEQSIWRKIFKKDFLIKNDIRFVSCSCEDCLFSMLTNYFAERIKHINFFGYFYRINPNSQLHNINTSYNIEIFHYISEYFNFYNKIKDDDTEFANKVKISALGDLDYVLPKIPYFTNAERKKATSYIAKHTFLINESGFFTGKKARYFQNFELKNQILNFTHPLYVLKRKIGKLKRKIFAKIKK